MCILLIFTDIPFYFYTCYSHSIYIIFPFWNGHACFLRRQTRNAKITGNRNEREGPVTLTLKISGKERMGDSFSGPYPFPP